MSQKSPLEPRHCIIIIIIIIIIKCRLLHCFKSAALCCPAGGLCRLLLFKHCLISIIFGKRIHEERWLKTMHLETRPKKTRGQQYWENGIRKFKTFIFGRLYVFIEVWLIKWVVEWPENAHFTFPGSVETRVRWGWNWKHREKANILQEKVRKNY